MELERIKNLVKQNGDKFILVENDIPEIVLMSFQEYEKLAGSPATPRNTPSSPNVTRTVYSELAETEFIIPLESVESSSAKPVRLEDISLEDLPL